MADPDDIIDPNDLDSIDALLDEAEMDAGDLEDIEPEMAETEPAEEEVAPPKEESQSASAEEDAPEDDQTAEDSEPDELEEAPTPEPLAEEVKEDSIADEAVAAAAGAAAATALNKDSQQPEKTPDTVIEKDSDKVSTERPTNTQKSDPTVKQMDSIKKIIIIFGASIIVLVLIAIGIGTWGALSASNQQLPEETQTMLETIKVNSEQNASKLGENLTAIEKKLDAVNFQVEQLAADLMSMRGEQEAVIDPLGLNKTEESKVTQTSVPVQPLQAPPQTVTSAVDPKVLKKIDSINYRLIKAQKAINTISSRVHKVQQTQQEIVHGVKSVEKQQLLEMNRRAMAAEQKAAEEKAKREKQQSDPYSYQTPDGMFYDQSVKDSYP